MKIIFDYKHESMINRVLLVWYALLEKKDIDAGLSIEQIKEEITLCLNTQFDGKTIW